MKDTELLMGGEGVGAVSCARRVSAFRSPPDSSRHPQDHEKIRTREAIEAIRGIWCFGLSPPAGLVKAPGRRAAPDTRPAGGAQGAAVSAALSGLLLWEGPYLVDAAFLAFFALSALAAASAGPDTGWAGPRVVMVAFAALFGGLQVPVLCVWCARAPVAVRVWARVCERGRTRVYVAAREQVCARPRAGPRSRALTRVAGACAARAPSPPAGAVGCGCPTKGAFFEFSSGGLQEVLPSSSALGRIEN